MDWLSENIKIKKIYRGVPSRKFSKPPFFQRFYSLINFLQIFLLICTIGVIKAIKIHKIYVLLQQLKIWILLYELQ